MRRLVECGLNIDAPEGRFEQSATHLAAFAGHVNVLQWLLENGAFPQKVVSIFMLVIIALYLFTLFIYHPYEIEEQGWCSSESTCLLPMWPRFDSQTWSHIWVEIFVGSRP